MAETDFLKSTRAAPERPAHLPEYAQWLSGEGAGSWFVLEEKEKDYFISRYSPNGKLECDGYFERVNDYNLNLKLPYKIIHLSHCQQVAIVQNNMRYMLIRVKKYNV